MDTTIGLLLLSIPVLFVLWAVIRVAVYFSDRVSSVSLPEGVLGFCVWIHRALLVIFAGSLAMSLAPETGLVPDWDGWLHENGSLVAIGAMALVLYLAILFICNFPGVPLAWAERVFLPVHGLLLLPLALLLFSPEALAPMAACAPIFFAFWGLNLADRRRCELAD